MVKNLAGDAHTTHIAERHQSRADEGATTPTDNCREEAEEDFGKRRSAQRKILVRIGKTPAFHSRLSNSPAHAPNRRPTSETRPPECAMAQEHN